MDIKKIYQSVFAKQSRTKKIPKINPNRLTRGNSKLDSSIFIFDVTAGKTCGKTCFKCYAIQSQKQYHQTELFRAINTDIAKNSDLLYHLITKQLANARKVKTVRIHSSGDFFNQDYINTWDSIIKQFPDINFYAYTKQNHDHDFNQIEKNPNFNLINSMVTLKSGEQVFNYGDLNHIKNLSNEGYFVCPATTKDWTGKCGKDCNYCITNKKVCFHIHYPGQKNKNKPSFF